MRNMGKRALALVCTIALLVSLLNVLSVVQANANSESSPGELTEITWSDLGITEDTTIVGGASDANNWGVNGKSVTTGKSLVNSSFRGTLKFRKANGPMYFQYGADSIDVLNTKGIRFTLQNDGTLTVYNMPNGGTEVVTLDATTAGLSSGTFINTAFELGIDAWQPEGSADLKMIVYINQQQYGSDPYVITNGAANMNAGVVLLTQGEGDFIDVTVAKEESPTELTEIAWSDFGITEDTTIVGGASDANNWGVNEKPVTSGKSLVNSSFRGTLRFRRATNANQYFQYGAESLGAMGAKGIRFAVGESGELKVFNMANGGTLVDTLDATTAGLSGGTFINTAFELGIDVWQPEDSADLKMIVYINQQQYGSDPYVITNGAANMNAGMVLVAQGEGDFIDITIPEEENVPDNLASVDWSDIGITENTTIVGGASDANNWGVNEKPVTSGKSLVNSSFRGTLRFRRTTTANQYFQYGANSISVLGTKGIRFAIGESGELKVFNMANGGTLVVTLDAATAGLSGGTFIDTAFELGIDVWKTKGSSDLQMKVYINKQQYGSDLYVITNGAANMNAGMVLVAQGEGDFIDITVSEEEEKDPSPEDLTSINWKSFGITADKVCRKVDDAKVISENPVSTLAGTSFKGNITFHRASAEDTLMLSVGCSANGWDGLRITQSDDALSLSGVQLEGVGVDFTTTITKEMAQVDSFSNQEMILGLDIWTTNQKDYKIQVYVNGNKVTETPIIWANAVTNGYLQNNLAYYATGASMMELLLHEAPDIVPDDLKSITWEDLKIDEDDYGYTTGGFSKIGTSENASLKGVSFRGKMKFIGNGAEMTFGDNSGGWQLGLNFIPQADGTLRVWNRSDTSDDKVDVILNPAQVGLESFLNQEFELGVDAWADGNNLKYIVYINGIRYNEKAYIWKGGATSDLCYDYLTIGLLVRDRSSEIAVLYPEVEKEASPKGLKKITWADFAIGNKKYTLEDTADQTGLLVKSNNALSNLLNTSFSGKIKFSKLTTDGNLMVCYGANGWNWDGIRISMTEDGKLRFQGMDLAHELYPVIVDVTTKKAGVESFNGQTLTLGIDIWKSGNDAKINIFVNGVQCTTRAYVWKDAVKNKCVGNGMNLVVDKKKDSLTVESIVESFGNSVKPAASLKEISFSSFGISNKVYKSKHPDFAAQGGFFDPAIGKSLNGTLLNVDLCFTGESVEFRYGGMDNAWEGLVIRSSGENLLLVDTSGLLAEFVPEFAGTELTNQTINLKISLNYVDSDHDGKKDDVKLGFWFNDVLYKNQFIYLNNYAAKLGSRLGIYIPEGSGTLRVSSAKIDNSIDFGLFGFTKNFKTYLIKTGIPKEIRTKL